MYYHQLAMLGRHLTLVDEVNMVMYITENEEAIDR
jgi:hypothetical protein